MLEFQIIQLLKGSLSIKICLWFHLNAIIIIHPNPNIAL